MLSAIEEMSRLELVWERLRLALGALINADAKWLMRQLPSSFVTEHSDYRLSKVQIEKAMRDAEHDGLWLLSQIDTMGHLDWQALPEVVMLRRVLDEQFEGDDTDFRLKSNQTACGDVIASPHDPDVRYSQKDKTTTWKGYKLQVTETVDTSLSLITDIGIHSAVEPDSPALDTIQQRLSQRGVLPEQQYVDRAYCNGKTLHHSS